MFDFLDILWYIFILKYYHVQERQFIWDGRVHDDEIFFLSRYIVGFCIFYIIFLIITRVIKYCLLRKKFKIKSKLFLFDIYNTDLLESNQERNKICNTSLIFDLIFSAPTLAMLFDIIICVVSDMWLGGITKGIGIVLMSIAISILKVSLNNMFLYRNQTKIKRIIVIAVRCIILLFLIITVVKTKVDITELERTNYGGYNGIRAGDLLDLY